MRRALILLAVLAGCTKKHDEPPPPPAPAGAHTAAPVESPDAIALTAPGTEPRAQLRYHFTPGAKAMLDIAMDLAMKSPDLPAASLGTLPSPRFRLAMEITAVDPDGTASLRSTILGTGATDQPGERVKATAIADKLAPLSGLAFVAKVSPTGTVTGSALAPGAKAPPELAGQLEQLQNVLQQVVMALPAEPIGKDGTWTVTKKVAQQGLAMTVSTTFKLVEAKPDAFSFTSTSDEHATPQAAAATGTHVVSVVGHGEASGTVGLAQPAMSGEMKTNLTTTVASGSETQHMTLDLGVHVSVLPPGSDAPITAPGPQGAHSAP